MSSSRLYRQIWIGGRRVLYSVIQKFDEWTKRYRDMYICDNGMQISTAMEDFEYTKWLDTEGVPCYVRDRVKP